MYQNVATCIKVVSQCIEIHFYKPSTFLYLWNTFVGKLDYLHCIKMGIKIHLSLIHSQLVSQLIHVLSMVPDSGAI